MGDYEREEYEYHVVEEPYTVVECAFCHQDTRKEDTETLAREPQVAKVRVMDEINSHIREKLPDNHSAIAKREYSTPSLPGSNFEDTIGTPVEYDEIQLAKVRIRADIIKSTISDVAEDRGMVYSRDTIEVCPECADSIFGDV